MSKAVFKMKYAEKAILLGIGLPNMLKFSFNLNEFACFPHLYLPWIIYIPLNA